MPATTAIDELTAAFDNRFSDLGRHEGRDRSVVLTSWPSVPVEIVRASVYTSYNRSTDKHSLRAKMFEEMGAANYDVHIMETMGKGEKCVDIQLAVEMLHYATVPNAYDVAILLRYVNDVEM